MSLIAGFTPDDARSDRRTETFATGLASAIMGVVTLSSARPLAGLGVGAAWRPEIAGLLTRLATVPPNGAPPNEPLRFSEVVAENVDPDRLPPDLATLLATGATVVPHGVTLGLAGAEPPDPTRLARLAALATATAAPLVSEHVAFVRAGADPGGPHADLLRAGQVIEAGHLVPPPRTRAALAALVDNLRIAGDALPVPIALENVAATLRWPEDELSEPAYLTELVERSGCWLVLDVANLYATCSAHGGDPHLLLRELPLERVAYVHVAGGELSADPNLGELYVDTHAHPMLEPVLDLLTDLVSLLGPDHPAVLLERDGDITPAGVAAELDRVRAAVSAGLGADA